MNPFLSLLKEATRKQLELQKTEEFKKELLDRATPILWFGDTTSKKNRLLTLGANPSREEFLDDNRKEASEKLRKGAELNYLPDSQSRLKTLAQGQKLEEILNDKDLQQEVLNGFNNYFKSPNPYGWFGLKAKERELSYNVEGFINGMDASFFEGSRQYQAIHIDLMPFPTISNFKSILSETKKHIFNNNWARDFLVKLISELNPISIVVFGRTNLYHFLSLMDTLEQGPAYRFEATKDNGKKSVSDYFIFQYRTLRVIGLSVNLGNPKGFNKETLYSFGCEIKQTINSL